MSRLICLDLETTGVDIETAQIVQFGAIEIAENTLEVAAIGASLGDSDRVPREQLCNPGCPIPSAATAIHKITDDMVKDALHFSRIAASVFDWIGDALVVTFNGATYDLPILARHKLPRGWRPQRHIDVMRVWEYARRTGEFDPADIMDSSCSHSFPASIMTGSLMAAYTWTHGCTFDGAHDALADCRATLDVLEAFTRVVDLDWCERITRELLPGDVDWSGKLKWAGDEIVFAFGKHKDKPVRDELHGRGYVSWMLGADFPEDTCKILRAMQRGVFPKRETG